MNADTASFRGFLRRCRFPIEVFDVVIAVNSIDHVDDIRQASLKIRRTLRPEGLIRMHIHYHKAKIAEPLELSDGVVPEVFGWVEGSRRFVGQE